MVKYLVEIGTEELPYKFIPSAMEQLKENLAKALEENRIEFKNIITYGTPRRLAVIVEDISESQPDLAKKIKGPPAKAALDNDGNLTQAGQGFAKKQGIDPSSIYKEAVGDIEYIFADVKELGKKTSEVLKEIIPDVVLKLQGSHFMRWGDLEIKFSRPIRWIVSLMDKEEVKLKIGNVESSRTSRGHRFVGAGSVEVSSPDTYLDDLAKVNVIVDQAKRSELIEELAKKTGESINGDVYLSPELVKEVTYIVESPVPVLGTFDKKYLTIPKDVIVTVMASHQRYFPVFEKNSDKLLNFFITMSNQDGAGFDNIKQGNERVIKARLDDAIFFYTEDTKRTLPSRVDDLQGITFQKGLGTMYDKILRLKDISAQISKELNLDPVTSENIEMASIFSKADLGTNLVREFTELQGVIGCEYAKLEGINEQIAVGVKEHYMPISADGELADTITGQVVGIADKIDTICGVFALGKAPTGSADPLGLRRAALGVILTILNKDININISEVIVKALDLQPIEIKDKEALLKDIREFIIQRFRIVLNESYKYDVVEAALSAKDPLADLKDVVVRAKLISELVKQENYTQFHEAANRIHRITRSQVVSEAVNPELLNLEIEKELWDCVVNIENNSPNYEELIVNLKNSIQVIQEYFDKVLVMDPDEKIRNNRLAVLNKLYENFLKIADFSKVVA